MYKYLSRRRKGEWLEGERGAEQRRLRAEEITYLHEQHAAEKQKIWPTPLALAGADAHSADHQ